MPGDASLPPHLEQLAVLCRERPVHQPKTIVVPKKQVGRTIGTALAAAGVSWVNVETVTLAGHAASRAARLVRRERLHSLPPGADLLIIDALLEERPDVASALGGHAAPGLARALLQTIRTLRLAGIAPRDLSKAGTEGRPGAVAQLYEGYCDYLKNNRLLDEAATIRLALTDVTPAAHPGLLAVFDEVELPALHRQYLDKLQREARRSVRIAHRGQAEPPPMTAGAQLASDEKWEVLEAEASRAEDRRWHFAEAVGAQCEVKAVLRGILEGELPLDTVEVAYPKHDPHLTLFLEAAHRHDLPVTLAAGTPALRTRTGQALAGFCQWIEEGFELERLVRMLRGGLIATDRLPELEAAVLPHEVATLAAEHGAGEGREALARLQARLEEESSRAGEDARRKIEAARTVLERLAKLAPEEAQVTAGRMASTCMAFLRLFGPAQLPPEKKPSDYTPDEHALAMLMQRLIGFGEDVPMRGRPNRLACRIREMTGEMFVGARAPRPGHLHVVPLSSAGYSGRAHLFVVGMDEAHLSTRAAQDPLLLDDEREVLARQAGTQLPLESEQTAALTFHFERAAASAVRSITLIASCLDLESGRELARSAAFIEALEASGAEPMRHSFEPHAAGGLVTDELELQLLTRSCRAATTERFLEADYPGPRDGRQAAAARAEEQLTAHDGWLGEIHAGESDLDPLGTKVSASRLEDLTACPYRFFLKYVLGLRAPREKELEIGECLDALEQGSVLHGVFERFMRGLGGENPREEHRETLHGLLREELEERHEARLRAHPAAARAMERRLKKAADVFLNAEIHDDEEREPAYFELGFGLNEGEARTTDDHEGELLIDMGDGLQVRLRGWVDRVDRASDGTLVVWDYKTGSHKRYGGKDLLQDGEFLQWALYGYALEQLFSEETVSRAGYFFTSARGGGQRLADDPAKVRGEIAGLIRQRVAMARDGLFPPAPSSGTCKYCDYSRVCGPAKERKSEIAGKLGEHAEGHPGTEHLEAWNYG